MKTCGNHFMYLHKRVPVGHEYIFVPSRCKSWGCEHCRPLKAKIVRNYVKDNFDGDNIRMLTFTLFHSGNPEEAWRQIGDHWNRLRTNVAKQLGKFTYMRVVEPHKDGTWPHLHVLIKGAEKVYKLFEKCVKAGFGWNAHCQSIPPDKAALYVSKYLTKGWPAGQADALRVLSKTRIVSVSRDLPPIFTKKSSWDLISYSQPNDITLGKLNLLIAYCQSQLSTYQLSMPFDDGFKFITDIEIPEYKLAEILDPYIWEYSDGMSYTYAPIGIQQVLLLEMPEDFDDSKLIMDPFNEL